MEERGKAICTCLLIWFSLFILMEITIDDQSTAKATTIDVGPGQTYTTIQEGIDAAIPGETVYVHASVYYENIVINKTINLTGENKAATIIDGSGSGSSVFIDSADYVNISVLSIRNGTYGIYGISSSFCNISDNIIHDNSDHGIWLESVTGSDVISNNSVYNSSFF